MDRFCLRKNSGLSIITDKLHDFCFRKVQRDLDNFAEIPFETIKHLIEEAKDDIGNAFPFNNKYIRFPKYQFSRKLNVLPF